MSEKRGSLESDKPLEVAQHDIRLLAKNRSAARSVEKRIRDQRPSPADRELSSEKAAPQPISWEELEQVRRGGNRGLRPGLHRNAESRDVSASRPEKDQPSVSPRSLQGD
jgi:hypothetical protein